MIRVIENLSEFVMEPVPEGALVRCRVTRSRKGVDRGERGRGGGAIDEKSLNMGQQEGKKKLRKRII